VQAIEEGRRLYVGNMPYEATSKDVEKLLEDVAVRIGENFLSYLTSVKIPFRDNKPISQK